MEIVFMRRVTNIEDIINGLTERVKNVEGENQSLNVRCSEVETFEIQIDDVEKEEKIEEWSDGSLKLNFPDQTLCPNQGIDEQNLDGYWVVNKQ